jgi:hypothetical protein
MNTLEQALDTFRRGPELMQEALRGVTTEESKHIPAPGKWSIGQLARHVADTEIVVGMRLRQIIAEDRPTLIPFDQELWAEHLRYTEADVTRSLAIFSSLRSDLAETLDALPPTAFDRMGVHPERGEKSLLEWVTLFGNHAETHAKQIRGIRESMAQK